MIKRLILGTLLLFYWSFCYAEKSNPPSIDSVFPTLNQEVYPFKNYGITETNIIGQLPDGRVFLITDSGDAFIFNGKSWQLMPDSFPESVSKTYVDSEGLLWIGGVGYFGYMDESFEYIEFSTSEFAGQITSSLPFYWIYETDEWLHFANNKTICHYNRITKEKKVTKFEGMFDAYHWIHRGELYLGTKSKIEKWFNGEFQHNLDWNHEYRAFHGWEHEGREYFLNATHLYVYEGDTHVQTIRDELMKMKGVVHLPVGEYVYLFTLNGMIQMSLNGKCDGYFFPWFHERVTRSTIHSPQYFGNGDAWFLTDNAIFRINSFEYAKDLSVETGYPITGSWDIENHNGDVYVASGRGFEKWHSTERNFSEPEGAPDFATYGIWKYKEELIISTWVELGSYEDQYSIKRSDGTYVVFAKSNQDGRFWVNKDSGIVLMDENFDIVTKVKGIAENVSSFVEFKGLLWVVSTDGRLFRANWEEQASLSDASHWFLESSGLTEPEPMRILSFGERLYLMTAKQWFEIKENQVFPVSFPIKKGWSWEIPHYSSEEDAIMLLQRNDRQNGCKIGILQEDTEGNLTWSPGYVLIESSKDSVRRLKRLEGFKENLAAVISSTSLELVKLDELPDTLPKLNPPIFVGSVNDLGVSDGRTYRFNPNSPLAIQLHHSKNSLQRPLTYAARLSKKGQSWIFREDGSFMYPGFLRGKLTFDAYVVDPWGNRSDIVSHTIRIIPPWYLSNYAIIAYLCLLFSTIVLSVQLRTRQLRRKSKELENIVDARTTDLMLANQAKSIFVSNVSHEIRNPLNGLLGLAQNLNEGDVIDKGTLQRLRRPSFYLYRFLSNVLDFSKFETGGIRLNKRVFDPNELLDSVESMFAGDFQERNLTFVADYRYENDPFLCASQEAIEMILVNLVGNAVKFTPPGGNIRTAMRYSDGWLTLTVADTGIGISDEVKERIFEPYEQGDQGPLVTGEKGAGIGLSLVKQTVKQLGGYVDVTSEVENGSTFTASIPVSPSDQSEIPGIVDEVRLAGRFLLVEDLEYNLKLLTDTLTRWGGVVDGVSNGQEALQKIQSSTYDMAIVDYDLPDMNGSQVAGEIRKSRLNAKIPIIGLSAYTDQEFIQKALDGGMNDFQFKPVNVQKLVKCIHKFIPEKIHFTLKKKMISENGRTSLRTIKRSGPGGSESLETSAQAYLDQLDKLVQSLNKSDLGSKEFETILHQLKGHSNLIHHRTSSQYWQHISEASKTGERMKALEELDSLQEIVEEIKKQIESLLLLEADFESQSQKRESFNYGSLSYTKESIKY